MKKFAFLLVSLALVTLNSCTKDEFFDVDNTVTTVLLNHEELPALHSTVLDCDAEILKEQHFDFDQLTSSQRYVVTQEAVLLGTQKYISQKEGKTLTTTEQNTLKKEVSNYWNDSNNKTLMKRFPQSSNPIKPTTGNSELNFPYKHFTIKPEVQTYLNRMLGNIDSPDYENYLDQLYMEVWSRSGLPKEERTSLTNAITVTKDSYIYWPPNTPMARLSSTAKCIIYSDAIGAVSGIRKGIGRAIANLAFGPEALFQQLQVQLLQMLL